MRVYAYAPLFPRSTRDEKSLDMPGILPTCYNSACGSGMGLLFVLRAVSEIPGKIKSVLIEFALLQANYKMLLGAVDNFGINTLHVYDIFIFY